MSADLLRRAAKVLREHADNDLTTGPWGAAHHTPTDEHWVRGMFGATVAVCGEGYTVAPRDAAYIALMHPPVALALADWLEVQAEYVEEAQPGTAGPQHHAFAVARTILREDAS